MGLLTLQIPQVGQPNSTEDPKVASNFTAIQAAVNGNIDPANLSTATMQSFLQLAAAGSVDVAFGAVTVPANGTNTATVTVTHGLPRTPTVVIAVLDIASSADLVFPGSRSASTFVLSAQLTTFAVVPSSSTAYWVAIG